VAEEHGSHAQKQHRRVARLHVVFRLPSPSKPLVEPDDASWAELAQRRKQNIEVLDAPPVDLAPGQFQANAVTGSSVFFSHPHLSHGGILS